jgi:hypothetical protein
VAETPVSSPFSRSDWLVCLLLFAGLSSLYFATTSGITSSNDGSHYALARSLVENGTFALKQYDDYAEGNDIAIHDDVLYSDRPPGTGLLATLFYRLGDLLPSPLAPLPSRHDPDNPHLLYVMLLPVGAGTGTAVLLYLLLRQLGIELAAALTAVVMFALGTAHWKYSTVLFSHALSSFLVALSLFIAHRLHPPGASEPAKLTKWHTYFFLGVVSGYAVLVEYSNGLLVILIALYLLWRIWPFTSQHLSRAFIPFVAGGLIPALFLAYYNSVNFGSPFTLSYTYAINYPWAGDFRTTFNYPLLAGLRSLLIFGTGDGQCDPVCYNQGLLLLSPVFWLALPGFILYWRQSRPAFLLTTAVFLSYLLLFAAHRTSHGFTADGRYLVPYISLLAIPIAYTLAWLRCQQANLPVWHPILALLVYGLFFLSFNNMIFHIGFSYNYTLELGQLSDLIAAPQNWRYIASEILRNSRNLPLLWLLEGAVLLLLIGWLRLKKTRQRIEA